MLNFYKKYSIILWIVVLSFGLPTFAGCGKDNVNVQTNEKDGTLTDSRENETLVSSPTEAVPSPTPTEIPEPVFEDFAAGLKLDMNSDSAKTTATVYAFVDGDTVHFNVPTSVMEDGILKARFCGINTPESTGKIQEYGKAASKYTKGKLEKATSIVLESDNDKWNHDATGSRYMVWVWYKTDENEDYRNLNLEILQDGYATSTGSDHRYGDIWGKAFFNAQMLKLVLFSEEPDPDFYYGDAIEMTLKQLRLNAKDYEGKTVAFEGIVTQNTANTAYVEEYDPETGLNIGIAVYYGTNLNGQGIEILSIGNRVRIVGSCVYYTPGGQSVGHYQITNVTYKTRKPTDPGNIQKLDNDFHEAAYVNVDADLFANGRVTLESVDPDFGVTTFKTFSYGEILQYSTVEIEDLTVTFNPGDLMNYSVNEAMTLYCKTKNGATVQVRTNVLYDENGDKVDVTKYEGCNITVKGIVECYDGIFQVKVSSKDHITINQ